jgi:hypothetical protein
MSLVLDGDLTYKLTHPEYLNVSQTAIVMQTAETTLRTMDFERNRWRQSFSDAVKVITQLRNEVEELRPDATRFRYLYATADAGRDLRAEVDAEMEKNSAP